MKFKKLIVLATIGLFFSSFNISYAEDLGTRKLVGTTKDPKRGSVRKMRIYNVKDIQI
ncbi:TPA: hypothetical protein I0472_002691 [Staphylococcus aureus]|nr:hypothetical protein [Staphylococcus aureus]HAR2881269.1 hypothetical protein [Staphylococcus aureus]HAR2883931.1 hypothetical protein [Staphylococcus aureus]HAR2903044.1 hypothetical protein [Staphylococcus aureus]HAR2903109.1 hypothetical protein [Staphylococcus aureus]